MSLIVDNYIENVNNVRHSNISDILNEHLSRPMNNNNRTSALKLTLLLSIISNVPIIRPHKRYL